MTTNTTVDRPAWSRAAQLTVLVNAVLWAVAGLSLRYWRRVAPGDPEKTRLLFNGNPYTDFVIFLHSFEHFRTREFYATHYSYPPAAGMMLAFFYRLFANPLMAFYVTMLGIAAVAAVWFAAVLVRRGMRAGWAVLLLGATVLGSYPMQFERERANLEIVLFALVALGVAAYWRRWYWAAAVCIGAVTAAKLYPVTLLGLLVAKRRWKESALALVVAAALNQAGLWVMGPTVAEARALTLDGMNYMRNNVALAYFYLGWDHSLLALLKGFVYQPVHRPVPEMSGWLTAYMAAVALGGLLLYFLRIVRLPRTNQVGALIVILVLIPPLSYEYTLLHLYTVWAVLLLWAQRRGAVATRPVLWMFALLGVLTSPVTILWYMDVRIGGELKCLALLALLVLLLRYPLEEAGERALPGAPEPA